MTATPDLLAHAVHAALELDDGSQRPGHRWAGPADAADRSLLRHAVGPVLDVGCGPARATLALAESGIPALGIDISAVALASAIERGAPVLRRGVFERVPAIGRWSSVLLLDGNVGIGGDPVALLHRVRALLRPGGLVLLEVDGPGTATAVRHARLLLGDQTGPWFPWATIGIDRLEAILVEAGGLALAAHWSVDERWFAIAERIERIESR